MTCFYGPSNAISCLPHDPLLTLTCMFDTKKKIEILKTIFLLFSLAFQVEEELERILKFKKKVTGQVEQMLSNWRRQVVKLKAFLSQRFNIAEQEVTGKVPQQISWCIKIKKFARIFLASLQYCDNKFLSV